MRAGRDCRLPAARPAGQELPSARAFGDLILRASPVVPQHLASAPQAPCAGRQPAYLVQIRDCVSAGSDLPKVYFEAFPKHARTRAGEWGESLEGGSPSKFTKIPLPVTCLGAPSPRSQTGPGLKKAFAAFKSKPRINCAF